MQPRWMSAIEATTNTAVGLAVSIALTMLVLPLFGFHPSGAESIQISLIFTVASVLRGYALRRVFEAVRS